MFRRARLRLVAWDVGVLALILLGIGIAVFILFQRNMYSDVDPSLRSDALNYATRLVQLGVANPSNHIAFCRPPTGPPAPPSTVIVDPTSYAMVDCRGRSGGEPAAQPAVLRRALLGQANGPHTIQKAGHYLRIYSFPVTFGKPEPTAAVQVWRVVDAQVHQLNRLLQVLVGGGIAGLLLAGLGGLFLADRALVPIRLAFNRQRQFIADASHELRTPLTLIRSSAEMISQSADRLEAEDAALLHDIVGEVDGLSHLVTDLLTLARADTDQLNLKVDPIDVAALAKDVEEDVQPLARAKHLELRNGPDYSGQRSNQPATVLGDPVRLRQLLLILLDNAIKYTDPGGTVDVGVTRENGRVAVVVSDTGVGIPGDALAHVFERFYRVDAARTHETGGAGLGLSIAQWIVRAHRGDIQINSEPGKGTRVKVALPASDERS